MLMSAENHGERLAAIETSVGSIANTVARIDKTLHGNGAGLGHKVRLDRVERQMKWIGSGIGVVATAIVAKVSGWWPG